MKEGPAARRAWADYLALGPGRSLEKLAALYKEKCQQGARKSPVPTVRLKTLCAWSSAHGWQQRLCDIEAKAAADAEAAEREFRRQALSSGYALGYQRVAVLKEMADRLLRDLRGGKLWVKDVKQIGSGETAERVDIKRFNAAEVEQFRGLLDDIAKELGDRRQGIDVKETLANQNDDGLPVDAFLEDPALVDLASRFAERMEQHRLGQGNANGAGPTRQPGEVAASTAP